MSEDALIHFILQLKYFAIFLGAFIEGPAVGLIAGFLAKLNYLNLPLAYLVHVAGDFTADYIYYLIGYWGGEKFLPRASSFLHFSTEESEKIKHRFKRHSWKIILGGKLTHVVGLPVLIGVGLSRYPWYKFGAINLLATVMKSAILVAIGYFGGHLWSSVNNVLTSVTLITLFILLIQVVYFVAKRLINYKKNL